MAKQKEPYMMMDAYVALYKTKFGKKPTINRYREKWGFGDMIDSIGYDRSMEVMRYFFDTVRGTYSPQSLFNNFDKLDVALAERDADRERRAAIRKETEQRVIEWEATHES